ncbi:MAG: DNA-processing protein DprA [Microthrixaceae bacterium]
MSHDPDGHRGAAILLAGLPGMGPRRLSAFLDAWAPAEAWARATSGVLDRLTLPDGSSLLAGTKAAEVGSFLAMWQAAAATADGAVTLAAHRGSGIVVLLRDDSEYPDVLRDDIEPPAVLFALGDLECVVRARAAVVGTRRCTGVGAGLARELGRDLATNDVAVVSGLALGIDGAAHRGVLDARSVADSAPPVGVVGSGLDVVYPARHRELWHSVASGGLLLSEAPLGVRPAAWRFPARNRIIAALADVVVVVESHANGGSQHTVTEAERRDVPILAVPGSVRSPAAAGTNQLLAEGCHPARDVTDVLVALGLTPAARRGSADRRSAPDATGQAVLSAFDWEPATLEHLAVRTGIHLAELAVALEALVAARWVERHGGWYERVAAQ